MRKLKNHMKQLRKKVIREARQLEQAAAEEKALRRAQRDEFGTKNGHLVPAEQQYVVDEKPVHPEARPWKQGVRRYH